jgi:single-strand DNA-binding protein
MRGNRMISQNKAIIIGNLGKDPEVRTTQTGKDVVKLNVATTIKYKKNDVLQEKTEWHNIVSFAPYVVNFAKNLHKGDKVYVEGIISTRSYEKDGEKKYVTEIIASVLQADSVRKEEKKEETVDDWDVGGDEVPF